MSVPSLSLQDRLAIGLELVAGIMDAVPRLIVLNGPPGCGKSTIARRYAADHPLALALDVDTVRGLLGRWTEHPYDAGLAARAIALAAARTHLGAGHDVVVPQFVGRPEFLEQLEALATETGAEFHELVLMDEKQNALDRFSARAAPRPATRRTARPRRCSPAVSTSWRGCTTT
jgi:predicted kinase